MNSTAASADREVGHRNAGAGSPSSPCGPAPRAARRRAPHRARGRSSSRRRNASAICRYSSPSRSNSKGSGASDSNVSSDGFSAAMKRARLDSPKRSSWKSNGYALPRSFSNAPLAALREVRPSQPRRAADRGEHVADRPEMRHLLACDREDHALPAAHELGLREGEPLRGALLHRVRREEVLDEQPMLELGGLGQRDDELLARVDERVHGDSLTRERARASVACTWPARSETEAGRGSAIRAPSSTRAATGARTSAGCRATARSSSRASTTRSRQLERFVLRRGLSVDDHNSPGLLMGADGHLTVYYMGPGRGAHALPPHDPPRGRHELGPGAQAPDEHRRRRSATPIRTRSTSAPSGGRTCSGAAGSGGRRSRAAREGGALDERRARSCGSPASGRT